MASDLENWLLFLGAGASRPSPTNLPPFGPLSEAVLQATGWECRTRRSSDDDRSVDVWRYKGPPDYPDIAHFDTVSEVLFGTLSRFGVKFANEICKALGGAEPNAVHEVAAHILKAGGCVWTTNIDDAVEHACRQIHLNPHRTGRRLRKQRRNPLHPLATSEAGTYVKFHGTVEAPNTLAFTDRQLIAPLSDNDIATLAPLASGRVAVFYGYAAADADLADLLDLIFDNASEVYWFEPNKRNHDLIVKAFPQFSDRINFVPDWTTNNAEATSPRFMATQFLSLAEAAEHVPDPRLKQNLLEGRGGVRKIELQLRQPGGATQAQLVERFGVNDANDGERAWSTAWSDDIRHFRLRTLGRHLRHRLSFSLYHSGSVATVTQRLAEHRDVLRRIWPRRLRNYFITRACALLLRAHDPDRLGNFVNWAISNRSTRGGNPFPSDLYYQSQAYRYSFLSAEARHSAGRAIKGLEDVAEPERLAGALYEAGDAALYQADFNAALDYAFQLRYRRGRYAIPRWQAWGAWLEVVALAHLGKVDPIDVDDPLEAMTDRFDFEGEPLNRADAWTAQLLLARVRLAKTGSLGLESLGHPTDASRKGRYLDDLNLVRADIAIATGDREDARRRLERVRERFATPISELWARLGLAELERTAETPNLTAAGDVFSRVAAHAHDRKAAWLEAQALLGLELCDPMAATMGQQRLETIWPEDGGLTIDEVKATPAERARVLWMVTL